MNTRMQELVFDGTSRITDIFPAVGARVLDAAFKGIGANAAVSAMCERHNRHEIRKMRDTRKFLVVSDIHIGDAVLSQSTLIAIRDFFPAAEVDYAVNGRVIPIIDGNPDATRIIPLFSNTRFPSQDEIRALRERILSGGYDLVLMLCPFLRHRDVAPGMQPFIDILSNTPHMLRTEDRTTEINHMAYQGYMFLRGLFSTRANPFRESSFRGVSTRYEDDAIEQALSVLRESGLSTEMRVVMFNPDSAVTFNMLPFEFQAEFLRRVASQTGDTIRILVGEGHTDAGRGIRLIDSIPEALRSRFRLIPKSLPLEVYSAFTDFADVYVSGDTGPLHIAASRKHSRSGSYGFRNRTAVLSFFGATTPRMSGYDTFQPGYLDSNQDAPAWCYQPECVCRNITCMNKMFKTCREVRCFDRFDVAALADLVVSYLDGTVCTTPRLHVSCNTALPAGCEAQ